MEWLEALFGMMFAIADPETLEDMHVPPGTAIVDKTGQLWQYAPPLFAEYWFAANGYARNLWTYGWPGGPEFPVRIVHVD